MNEILVTWEMEVEDYYGSLYTTEKLEIFPANDIQKVLADIASIPGFIRFISVHEVKLLVMDDILRECEEQRKQNQLAEKLERKLQEHVEYCTRKWRETYANFKEFENMQEFSVGEEALFRGVSVKVTDICKTDIGKCYKCDHCGSVDFRFGWELEKK